MDCWAAGLDSTPRRAPGDGPRREGGALAEPRRARPGRPAAPQAQCAGHGLAPRPSANGPRGRGGGGSIWDIELTREGPSYTIDTLRALKRARPEDELYFIIGADTVGDCPRGARRRACSARRGSWSSAGLRPRGRAPRRGRRPRRGGRARPARAGGECRRGRRSTEVRRLIREDAPGWEALLPPGVPEVIKAERLYGRSFVTQVATVDKLSRFEGQRHRGPWLGPPAPGQRQGRLRRLRDGSGFLQCVGGEGASWPTRSSTASRRPDPGVGGHGHAACRAQGRRARRAATSSTSPPRRRSTARGQYPISPKEHGTDFLMDHRHLWLRSQRQHAILRVRHDDHQGRPRLLRRARLHARRRADLHAERVRGDVDALRDRLPRRARRTSTQSGQLYMEAAALAFGKVVLLRPDVPRREVEDAPPPRRVLDGRARGRVHATSTATWTLAEDFLCVRRRRACSRRGATSSRSSSATSRSSRT